MRVLVIEDDQETATFLKRALKESGHVAEYAGDGKDKPMKARGHLLVTVPVYMRWFNPEATK